MVVYLGLWGLRGFDGVELVRFRSMGSILVERGSIGVAGVDDGRWRSIRVDGGR